MEAYLYDDKNKLLGKHNCQIDPLESELRGKTVYCMPNNATLEIPPAQKDGFDIVWNGKAWEYVEIPKSEEPKSEPYIPTEQEKMQQKIAKLKRNLADTDFKAIKKSEGYYTEEEYAPIKAQRQAWRDEINELEKKLTK